MRSRCSAPSSLRPLLPPAPYSLVATDVESQILPFAANTASVSSSIHHGIRIVERRHDSRTDRQASRDDCGNTARISRNRCSPQPAAGRTCAIANVTMRLRAKWLSHDFAESAVTAQSWLAQSHAGKRRVRRG